MNQWDVPPSTIYQPWNPNIDHTPPPIGSVEGRAQPVLRIPIAGPAPFNTLAVVRGRGWIGLGPISDNILHEAQYDVPTHLKIPGFDPDKEPQDQPKVAHSTSASLLTVSSWKQRNIENDDGSEFTTAIDLIETEAIIDDQGKLSIRVHTASAHNQTSSADFLELTSWVLYFDPDTKPLDERVLITKLPRLEKRKTPKKWSRVPRVSTRDPQTGKWIEIPKKGAGS